MAFVYSDIQAVINAKAFGQPLANRSKSNKSHGSVRIFQSNYTAPATGAPAIGDKIVWGEISPKARILGHLSRIEWSTGNAACTINLGDNVAPARHLAATAITTAGSAVPQLASANGASFENSDNSNNLNNNFGSTTDDCTLISVIAGAALLPGQVITLTVMYVQD